MVAVGEDEDEVGRAVVEAEASDDAVGFQLHEEPVDGGWVAVFGEAGGLAEVCDGGWFVAEGHFLDEEVEGAGAAEPAVAEPVGDVTGEGIEVRVGEHPWGMRGVGSQWSSGGTMSTSFLIASAEFLSATRMASSVSTTMRSLTPRRAMRFPEVLKTMLPEESIWESGALAALRPSSAGRYLPTEIHEPTSSQSKVASTLRTRLAFSMRA